MTKLMSCSTSRMVRPCCLEAGERGGQLALLQVAQAGGGLVEQQQDRIEAERAGDLDDAQLPQRQAAGGAVHVRRQPHALDLAGGLVEQARLLGAIEARDAGERCPWLPRRWAPSATFSSTLMLGCTLTCWKVRAMPRRGDELRASGPRCARP